MVAPFDQRVTGLADAYSMTTGEKHMASQASSTTLAAKTPSRSWPGDSVVVHLTSSRFFGGPERQMLELARESTTTWQTTFASFSEEGLCRSFLGEAREAGFKTIELSADTPRLVRATREVTQLLQDTDASVLCCHGYKANLLGWLAARRAGIPVVSVSRGWTGECAKVRLYEWLDRRVLRRMDHVVCVSHGQAEKVRHAGVADEKVTVIHNAVRPQRFEHPKPEYRRRLVERFPVAPKVIVAAAGRLSPEKGFDLLIDAAATVTAKQPEVGFVLFGDGPLREQLDTRIKQLGLTNKFIVAGFRDNLDDYFPHFDLFAQSSHTEGLPNVILEAFAAGVPVVATAVGGTREIVDDGINGLLIPPGDTSALASAITRLTADASPRAEMGTAGRHRVETEFTFTAQADAYRRMFQSLVYTGR